VDPRRGDLHESVEEVKEIFTGKEDVKEEQANPSGVVFCNKCKISGHYTRDCWKNVQGERHGNQRIDQVKLSELVAPLCATQVEGQGFFCIPNRPSQINVRERERERANIAIVTVLKGDVPTKQLEGEFTRILSRTWRWTTRKVANNKFTVRFPTM
jgi:hypothetical protein